MTLYDVHYETAGETSSFYSHVDGLNKENADKLVAFLNDKARGQSSQTQNIQEQPMSKEPSPDPQPTSDVSSQIELSRENCPLSSVYLISSAIYDFIFTIAIFVFFGIFFIRVSGAFSELTNSQFRINIIVLIAIIIFLVVWLILFIFSFLWFKYFNFAFNQERGKINSGVISRSESFLYYDRIQNINLWQGFLDRILGINTLTIETAGETSGNKFNIPALTKENAEKIRDFLLEKAKSYKKNL